MPVTAAIDTCIVYVLFLLVRRNYIQSFPEEARAYIKRRRVWNGIAWVCAVFIVGMFVLTGQAADETLDDVDSTAGALGVAIGSGLIIGLTVIPAGFLWLISMLMSWRNSVGLKNEVRHQEALKSK